VYFTKSCFAPAAVIPGIRLVSVCDITQINKGELVANLVIVESTWFITRISGYGLSGNHSSVLAIKRTKSSLDLVFST